MTILGDDESEPLYTNPITRESSLEIVNSYRALTWIYTHYNPLVEEMCLKTIEIAKEYEIRTEPAFEVE